MLKCIFIAGNLFIVSPDGERAANISMAQSVRSTSAGDALIVTGMDRSTIIALPRAMTAEQAIRDCDAVATAEVVKMEAF
ncbi:hypothetical protein LOS78_01645 [Paracoccus sp. MA]|uniref:hypothetical protein n=1 Tax=Paracoccus sp. MA TaxID=2895796 RepID=UPI001E4DC8A1|nr:hypothetical protein [Paracoccus sp. MA]UFM64202.1 hypothetical protein LOS78_01645 [Paracoccus sp. MA]